MLKNARPELRIKYVPLTELRNRSRHVRTHTQKQIRRIVTSIERFGFKNPVIAESDGTIVCGHARVEAATRVGLDEVPVIYVTDLTREETEAYVLAENRAAETGGWNPNILPEKLRLLDDAGIDLSITGFESAEIEAIFNAEVSSKAGAHDQIPELTLRGPPTTRVGDLWVLGRHRLVCDDARDPAAYDCLLQGKKAQMVITDPPYNVAISTISGKGAIKHDEFKMASGEMSSAEFEAFLRKIFENLVCYSACGSIHYIFMDWKHALELLSAGKLTYTELKNIICWQKTNAGMGSFYRSMHELVFVYKNGTSKHINNFGLGQFDRHRTNVWTYAGLNVPKAGREEELALHPTVKPVELLADALKDCSRRNGIVLDPFGGSGSLVLAAEITQRSARVIEIDPKYVDVAIRRWQKATNEAAILAGTGQNFDQVAKERAI